MSEEYEKLFHVTIPLGSKILDDFFKDGIQVGSVIGIAGGVNSGKSNVARSFGINALKAKDKAGMDLNLKVLHLSLEGDDLDGYISGLQGEQTNKMYFNRLIYKTNIHDFDVLYIDLLKIYRQFRFNVIVLDYPQILNNAPSDLITLFKEIKKIAVNLDSVIFCPISINEKRVQARTQQESELKKILDIIIYPKLEKNGLSLTVQKWYSDDTEAKFSFNPDFNRKVWIE